MLDAALEDEPEPLLELEDEPLPLEVLELEPDELVPVEVLPDEVVPDELELPVEVLPELVLPEVVPLWLPDEVPLEPVAALVSLPEPEFAAELLEGELLDVAVAALPGALLPVVAVDPLAVVDPVPVLVGAPALNPLVVVAEAAPTA
ncbi:MAG: hypothetical protein RLZZ603_414 [Actinomycetota bacterium]